MVPTTRRVGVVLFQLGGPESLEAIEPFLFNLFCDPDIIDFPFARIGRKPLAKLISTTRARKVQHHYEVIGGGSPIRRWTERQAKALQESLSADGIDARCFVAMRYWHPFTDEAIAQLEAAECDEIVLLPLYPQYSSTTTGSSLNEWRRRFNADGRTVHSIESFHLDALYLDSLVEKINEALERFPAPADVQLVFSAHSVPVAVIERGDPYQRQIQETVAAVMQRGGLLAPTVRPFDSAQGGLHQAKDGVPLPWRLCYQSKVGASKWLQPSLRSTLRELGADGSKYVCVVPISFVSDHVETLGEIDHEARELAAEMGIRQFEMTEGLNDSPAFIAALTGLVKNALGVSAAAESGVERLVAAD